MVGLEKAKRVGCTPRGKNILVVIIEKQGQNRGRESR